MFREAFGQEPKETRRLRRRAGLIITSRGNARQRFLSNRSVLGVDGALSHSKQEVFELRDSAKAAPAIAVVPINVSVGNSDLLPPVSEFMPRNIKGGRRYQVVKDNRLLLSPPELGNCFQIIVIEKMAGDRSSAGRSVQWPVDRLGRRKH